MSAGSVNMIDIIGYSIGQRGRDFGSVIKVLISLALRSSKGRLSWVWSGEPSKRGGLGPFPKSDSPAGLEVASCLEFYSCQETDLPYEHGRGPRTSEAVALAETLTAALWGLEPWI